MSLVTGFLTRHYDGKHNHSQVRSLPPSYLDSKRHDYYDELHYNLTTVDIAYALMRWPLTGPLVLTSVSWRSACTVPAHRMRCTTY